MRISGYCNLRLWIFCAGLAGVFLTQPASYGDDSPSHYNEMFSADGQLREIYRDFLATANWPAARLPAGQQNFDLGPAANQFLMPERNSAPRGHLDQIVPVPVLLSPAEDEELSKGTVQLARALGEFFADLAIGQQRAIGPRGFISRPVVDFILKEQGLTLTSLKALYQGKSADAIHFFYSCDIARGPDGFVMLEDNSGFVQSLADKDEVLRLYGNAAGLDLAPKNAGHSDLAVFLNKLFGAKPALTPNASGVLAIFDRPKPGESNEFGRFHHELTKLAQQYGFAFNMVVPDQLQNFTELNPAVIFNLSDPLTRFGASPLGIWLIEKMFKQNAVPMLNAPATSMLSSQVLLPFLEAMSRFYLGEEPVLKVQPTYLLDERWRDFRDPVWVRWRTAQLVRRTFTFSGPHVESMKRVKSVLLYHNGMARAREPGYLLAVQSKLPKSVAVVGSRGTYEVEFRAMAFVNGPGDVVTARRMFGLARPLAKPAGGDLYRRVSIPIIPIGGRNGAALTPVERSLQTTTCPEIF